MRDDEREGLEADDLSPDPLPLSRGTHRVLAGLARHACRAFLQARRAYLEADDRRREMGPAQEDLWRGISPAMVAVSGAEQVALDCLLALKPGEIATGGATPYRGNLAALVDGHLFAAYWDDRGCGMGQPVDAEGGYRLAVVKQVEILDLTPEGPEAAPPPDGPPSVLFALGRRLWRVAYHADWRAYLAGGLNVRAHHAEDGRGGFFAFEAEGEVEDALRTFHRPTAAGPPASIQQ